MRGAGGDIGRHGGAGHGFAPPPGGFVAQAVHDVGHAVQDGNGLDQAQIGKFFGDAIGAGAKLMAVDRQLAAREIGDLAQGFEYIGFQGLLGMEPQDRGIAVGGGPLGGGDQRGPVVAPAGETPGYGRLAVQCFRQVAGENGMDFGCGRNPAEHVCGDLIRVGGHPGGTIDDDRKSRRESRAGGRSFQRLQDGRIGRQAVVARQDGAVRLR